jgi:hypothetical protein
MIHRMENVITLAEGFHTQFDNLWLWLEETVSSDFCSVELGANVACRKLQIHMT